MGSHPFNLAIRFLLEMTALISFGMWAWNQGVGNLRYLYAFVFPVIFAAVWGVFAVPDDPSRSGTVPVIIPGFIRLILELSFFAFAAWTQYDLGNKKMSLVLAIIVVLHYIISYDRLKWLLQQ